MPRETAQQAVADSLARIAARDTEVRAWLHVEDRGAHAAAYALDAEPVPRGPLHGVPIGVKDVFDTADMPTTHNSPLFSGHRPALDAGCVATLRAAGAIVLGKTDTTEFAAAGRNAATANPHDLSRTPGGSSSGSAAAVADGHVRLALATQTGGSTIRPASFCGIHGFKPTWGLVSREGVKVYANGLDTVAWHARSVDDLDLLCEAFALSPPPPAPSRPPRIALCRTPWWDQADPDGQAAVEGVAAALRQSGVTVTDIALPPLFDDAVRLYRALLFREGAAAFLGLARTRGALLHADFHERVESAATHDDADLLAAWTLAAEGRRAVEAMLSDHDAILTPSAPGVAPIGRAPGNPLFNQLWTMLHLPVVTLPLARGAHGLPIGVSLVAPRCRDRALLRLAREVEARLGPLGIRPTCAARP
jgi:Asp-tRNA(Asn)/Glu-tRNA(Gln) amidotransferase A subunit family amidase